MTDNDLSGLEQRIAALEQPPDPTRALNDEIRARMNRHRTTVTTDQTTTDKRAGAGSFDGGAHSDPDTDSDPTASMNDLIRHDLTERRRNITHNGEAR